MSLRVVVVGAEGVDDVVHHFLGGVADGAVGAVEEDGVLEHELAVLDDVARGLVLVAVEAAADRGQVHREPHHLEVLGDPELHRVHGLQEQPVALVALANQVQRSLRPLAHVVRAQRPQMRLHLRPRHRLQQRHRRRLLGLLGKRSRRFRRLVLSRRAVLRGPGLGALGDLPEPVPQRPLVLVALEAFGGPEQGLLQAAGHERKLGTLVNRRLTP
mmetsp:Transcript_26346/g.81031  ORF Transcript_26346/g.81031 Transcript_26346/m.81031 type:complete len:215 (+) Transcript_26346:823-1467(+)